MRNLWVLPVAMLVAGAFVACSSTTETCKISSDCNVGNVCRADKCVEYTCTGTADCADDPNTTGLEERCVDGSAVGKDAAKKFCTATQCDDVLKCTDGFTCSDGLCVPNSSDDVLPGDTAGTDTTGDRDVPAEAGTDEGTDTTPPPAGKDCLSCTGDAECGEGYKCLPVGASKHCLATCADDGDCPASYICYAASTANKSCLPVSYSCPACAADEPCDTGKVCDMTSGECKDGKAECGACTYDFDCSGGMRCYKKSGSASGVCVAGCSDSKPCADTAKFTCGANDKGVQICQPNDDETCKACPSDKPFPSDDGLSCWECKNNSQCDTTKSEVCSTTTHTCGDTTTCQYYECDSGCYKCCEDAHCPGDTGPCDTSTHKCTNEIDECNGSCVSPFPVCVVISGVPQCVQCEATADCAGQGSGSCTCTGDPTYTCLEGDGTVCQPPVCQAPCSSDADCPPGPSGETLVCSGSVGGICYNAKGTCDGATACCGGGSQCYDVLGSLFGGMGGIPGGGTLPSTGMAACTCSATVQCLGGAPCTATSGICMIPLLGDMMCPGGTPPATMPESLCIDIMELLGGLLGGI